MLQKILLLCLLISVASAGKAQKRTWLKEINQDIWLPFAEAYSALDAEKYKNLHTKDLIRAAGDERALRDVGEYSTTVARWFADARKEGQKFEIEFRFLERFSNGKTASERGIYALSLTSRQGKTQKLYGKFHVFLRKVKGKWKIAVDYDSSEGNTIDEQAFLRAFALDDWAKYE